MVYIISKNGKPLMPTKRYGKVRHLLKDGKAKVVSKKPFTIKLLYDSKEFTQELTLGVDTGSGTIGTAVSDREGNIVYRSEVQVRNDITEKMTQRSKYRRNRRSRKTRYRAARFLNRGNSKKLNRLAPTIKSKIQSHIREIEYIKKILPITKLVLETGKFDTHKLKNPNVRSWGYQKGQNYGFSNTHEYVLERDRHQCQLCKGKSNDSHLEVHHIKFRSQGGSDNSENLITLCSHCHKELHRTEKETGKLPNLVGKIKSNLNFASQMNVIRSQLLKYYTEAIETFGYITKQNRLQNSRLPKEHNIDACVIASEGKVNQVLNQCYYKKCVADGDYQKMKGIRSEQKIPTGKIQGFRKFDKVKYNGKEYFIKGRMSSGYGILINILGETLKIDCKLKGMKTPKLSKMKRICARKEVLIA